MPIVISPESELGKELAKWEQHQTHYVGFGQSPGNPYVFRPYPRMVYKASLDPNGKALVLAPEPVRQRYLTDEAYFQAVAASDALTQANQRTVHSETEYEQARREGWREDPKAALAHYEQLQQEIATAAAEAAHAAQRMTSKAQEERKKRDASTDKHVTD
jgi:hypothetical protein